jgi:hypothetical protein
VPARRALAADDQSPLWSYQERLVEAAGQNDPTRAAAANNDSLLNATSRIQEQLPLEREPALD